MEKIVNHQELLNCYYESESTVIWERSGRITEDLKNLDEQVKEYADRHGLIHPKGTRWQTYK